MAGTCCSRRSLLKGALGLGTVALSPVGLSRMARAQAPRLRLSGPATVGGLLVLAGSFHDHTTDSDGDAESGMVADYVSAYHDQLGLDFLSFTEHSDLFPASTNAVNGTIPWTHSRAVTDAHTGDRFVMLRGFEHTNDQENHLNVIESANWLAHHDELTMTPFYTWLKTTPPVDPTGMGVAYGGADGIGQFNHPRSKGPLNWDDYALDEDAARVMAMIEIRERSAGWYWFALSKGWTLGPVQNGDFHPWAESGVLANTTPGDPAAAGRYPSHRSLVIAESNTRASILAALRQRRTTATERPDLWATLRGPDGVWQGSTIEVAPGQPIELLVDAGTEQSTLRSVHLVTSGTVEDWAEFYGANGACVPGVEEIAGGDPDFCDQHTPGYELQALRFQQSGGKATFKGEKDTAPAARTLAPVALDGRTAQRTLSFTVPTTTTSRPDGKQFVYAVVTRADGARAFTSPIFLASADPTPAVPELGGAAAVALGAAALGGLALAARSHKKEVAA